MDYTKIDIDIEVNRAIEAARVSFKQSKNDILRQLLRLEHMAGGAEQQLKPARNRSTGVYECKVQTWTCASANLKDAYVECLKHIIDNDDDLATAISQIPLKARKIIATNKTALYKNAPHLAATHAHKFVGEWWIDLNLSEQQVRRRLEMACEIANLRFGTDVILNFPSDRRPPNTSI